MPIWMYERLDEQADDHKVSFSRYVQEVVRDHEVTPFEKMDEPMVCKDENYADGRRNEGAA